MSGLTGMGLGTFGNNDLTSQTAGMPTHERRGSRDQGQEDADGAAHVGLHKTSSRQSRHSISHDATRTGATSVTEVGTPQRDPRDKTPITPGGDTDTVSEYDDEEEERRNSAVQALAVRYTNQSQAAGIEPGTNIFLAASDPDSPLNPNGGKFRARTWAKAVVDMMSTEGHSFRTSGVAFQNLNVYGFGSATDYQKDVANIWMEAATLARRLLGQEKRRIDILRDFDGVVRKGEMLVVLGPPGSGCTTLLKTIAGDFNGIFVDGQSYFNYQGKKTSFH
jgi:ATP-binding cassette subfamily G (WHITE) protein 2 (PDR)